MLYMLREIPKFQILVCGGDGTAGWVLSILEDIQHKLKCKGPPTAVLPLGTGNDLARVLKWGAGYTGECCLDIIKHVMAAKEVKLDRWNVKFETWGEQKAGTESSKGAGNEVNTVTMNNYFGVGLDAQLSLEFHLSREEKPEKFNSRFRNKMVYFEAGEWVFECMVIVHSSFLVKIRHFGLKWVKIFPRKILKYLNQAQKVLR